MAKQLCEREVLPFAAMAAAIKADPGTEVTRETASFVEIQDPKRLMIWTLVKPSGDQPAAYICRRVVQEDGQVKIHLSAECVGRTLNCDGVIGRILSEQNRAMAPLRR
ncbi:hypothetical protein [Methylobacterium sp. R2-1]|uniref:hypothetical protein n=1 Tax=Methylobacterium sp. R2-1 TaxID=2587064 RepID=UPI0018252CA1|nr:hypothetical protein [Methylobacterium sp. R2-1]MBB2961984.1 hypothetical protein [Methylobacterium sp. R2-1]